jgi:hypothetical protein
MRRGDLVKITCRDGAINYMFGIFLSEGFSNESSYIEVFLDNRFIKLYKFDYKFEVINENR